jgi:hypothetical protein
LAHPCKGKASTICNNDDYYMMIIIIIILTYGAKLVSTPE